VKDLGELSSWITVFYSGWQIQSVEWHFTQGRLSFAGLNWILPSESTLDRSTEAMDVAVECDVLPSNVRLHLGKPIIDLDLHQGLVGDGALLVEHEGQQHCTCISTSHANRKLRCSSLLTSPLCQLFDVEVTVDVVHMERDLLHTFITVLQPLKGGGNADPMEVRQEIT